MPHYAPRLGRDRCGIRVNFVASSDGAVSAAGVFPRACRPRATTWSSRRCAILPTSCSSGWATAAAENYGPARTDRSGRDAVGACVRSCRLRSITRSLQLDTRSRLFTRQPAAGRDVCEPRRSSSGPSWPTARTCIVCGDDDIDYAAVRRALADARPDPGAVRGRPDDPVAHPARPASSTSCASRCRRRRGPGRRSHRRPGTTGTTDRRPLGLHSLLEEDGALFLRYTAGRAARR